MVQGTSLAALFNRADATALPALGGMARPNGVVIASERFFAFAGRDGSLLEGEMPRLPASRTTRSAASRHRPARDCRSRPCCGAAASRGSIERLVLFAVVLAPVAFVFLPSRAALVAGTVMGIGLVAWLMRGRTLYLHGAEHRAIAAAEQGLLGRTWDGEARPSRFSLRCGTNFVALALPMSLLADRLWPFAPALWTPVVVAVRLARADDGALAGGSGLHAGRPRGSSSSPGSRCSG